MERHDNFQNYHVKGLKASLIDVLYLVLKENETSMLLLK